jgi:hypothetical protein
VLCAAARPARAQSQAVRVTAGSCTKTPWSVTAWSELLRVELAADGVAVEPTGDAGPSDSDAPRVELAPASCDDAATTATLTCTDAGQTATRPLDLTDVAAVARPRVIAIAVAGLVRACVTARAPAPPIAERLTLVERPPPPPPPPPPSPSIPVPVAIGAVGEARAYTGDASLFGARAFAEVGALAGRLVVRGDAGFLAGNASDSLGKIVGSVVSGGASARARILRTARVELGVGLRGELGYGWFDGRAGAPTVIATHATSALAYVALAATCRVAATQHLATEIDLDAGTTVRGFAADADARPLFDVEGFIVAIRMGVTWRSR